MEIYNHEEIKIITFPLLPFYQDFVLYIYYVDGLLIDTGPRFRKSKVAAEYEKLPIKQVAITHHHVDHMGMAGWLSRHKDVDIYTHENTLPHIKKQKHLPWIYRFGRKLAGQFEPVIYPEKLTTERYEFIPIYTPGHTDDHVVLYEPHKKWLFTGDLYITANPKVAHRSESIQQYIESLEKILTLDFETIFCAHEGVVTDGREKIKEKIAYLKRMRKAATEMHQEGFTDEEIVKIIFPRQVVLESITFGAFSRKKFIKACYQDETE